MIVLGVKILYVQFSFLLKKKKTSRSVTNVYHSIILVAYFTNTKKIITNLFTENLSSLQKLLLFSKIAALYDVISKGSLNFKNTDLKLVLQTSKWKPF